MSVIKKCCVCNENIVEMMCEKCGMPYQENRNFYYLNGNMRDHVDYIYVRQR